MNTPLSPEEVRANIDAHLARIAFRNMPSRRGRTWRCPVDPADGLYLLALDVAESWVTCQQPDAHRYSRSFYTAAGSVEARCSMFTYRETGDAVRAILFPIVYGEDE